MSHLLDTCVLSEFRKIKPNQKVVTWLERQIEESLFLSVLVIGEIQKGISLLPSSKKQRELDEWLNDLVLRYDNRILPLSLGVMRRWGQLMGSLEKHGRVLPFLDSLIAATALTYDFVVVTRNENDFAGTGVTVLNIWE
jgi:predicted nucleic acid-binding protein